MPLDLKKVITHLKDFKEENLQDLNKERLDSTFKLFQDGCQNQKNLIGRIIETTNSKKANFFFAIPRLDENKNENLDSLIKNDRDFKISHITIATDGSQINPSAHEITSAFLINIGFTVIPYFEKSIPVNLSSEPTIYSTLENLYSTNLNEGMQGMQEEDLISYERTLKEIEQLLKLAKKYSSYKIPVIALLDGTLIHWHIEKFSKFFIEQFIKRFSDALLELKDLNIPVASFVSNSRSNDLINMLRIYKCPYEIIDCKKHCTNLDSKKLPCNPTTDYKPVLDRRLVERFMSYKKAEPGSRTVLFKSVSKILDYYPENLKVFFFYLNTGSEIARVEIPSYVACDEKLLNLIHNAIALQCKVGFGYPVTLSEAHLQAVVGKSDRQVFYELIKEQILKKTRTPVKLSSKEFKKRISFV